MKVKSLKIHVLLDDYSGYEKRGVIGQHGLSILIKTIDNAGREHSILFDTGQTAHAILKNLSLFNLSLKDVKVIALSHRHYDHTGGLLDILEKEIRNKVPIISHSDLFKPSIHISEKRISLNVGAPFTRDQIANAGGQLILLRNYLEISPGVYWLGEIPRLSNFGGLPENFYTIEGDELVKDKLLDDTGLAVNVDGLGLVVISGCSHSGIINMVQYASKIVKTNPYAVLGGFHLVNSKKEEIEYTAKALKELRIKKVFAGHCTGLKAECALLQKFGENFEKIHSGFSIEFKSHK